MRSYYIIGLVLLAFFLSGCGVSIPFLGDGPNFPTQTLPSATSAQTELPATETQPPAILAPTDTIAPADTPTLPPTEPPVTAAPVEYPFQVQTGSPRYLPAFTKPESGCAWVGVAGQVFDENQQPLEGAVVLVKGTFNGKPVDTMVLSGLAKDFYGPGGFEVQLGDQSADSTGVLTIQLVNDKFEPLSEAFPLTTYNDCQQNLILLNFQADSATWRLYLPDINQ
jgi:hypothetical protein